MPARAKGLSLGTRGLIGLGAGLVCGAAITASGSALLFRAGEALEIVGRVWINAILMTIVPLVFSKLFVSIAGSEDRQGLGRAGKRAAAILVTLLVITALLTAAVMPGVFARLPIDAEASSSLRAAATKEVAEPTSPSQWIVAMVPANAIRSASEGAMVPLVVFAAAFALGASRIAHGQRQTLVGFFQAVDSAISLLLGWVIALSPYGVFALAVGLAMRVGADIVSALGYYVLVTALVLIVCTAALYVVVAIGARISPRRFANACAPAQIVALSTHSSAASLPAMIEATERLQLPRNAAGFVLPLSLAVFKYSSPIWFIVATFFVGRLYGIPIDPSRMTAIVFMAVVTSFAVGGVPSGAAVMVGPVLLAAGLPAEAIGLLIAVDPLPNAFRTAANVTGMLAVTALSCGREVPAVDQQTAATPDDVQSQSIEVAVPYGPDRSGSGPVTSA